MTVFLERVRRNKAVCAIILVVLLYVGRQIVSLVSNPSLTLSEPKNEFSITGISPIFVKGNVSRDARITINQRPVSLTAGIFETRLYLAPGLNRIDVAAETVGGKTARSTRYVTYTGTTTASQ